MSPLSVDRLLAMSAIEAAFILRVYRDKNPSLHDELLIRLIRSLRSDFNNLDFEAGLFVEQLVVKAGVVVQAVDLNFYGAAISAIVLDKRPFWMRLAPTGRNSVVRSLSPNERQCFRNAGLLDAPPPPHVVRWWDDLAAVVRSKQADELMERGREGELLSLDYERNRLIREGIDDAPVWVAIEDNRAGYDILSYRRTATGGRANKLIEVKTTAANPPRFFLSRAEWAAAERYGEALEFHLWVLPEMELRVMVQSQIASHIPIDRGNGSWTQVEIRPAI